MAVINVFRIALSLFRLWLGEAQRAADARADLSICYWREGAYAEARAVLGSAATLVEDNVPLKAKTVLCFAMVESSAGRYSDTLHLLLESAHLFGEGVSHRLRGIFHNELAIALRRLGTAERRQDYRDRAIIEYTAAAYHFEQARLERHVGLIENNLAFLLYQLGRYREAHGHLDRAQMVFTRLRDAGSLAHVDETRARVLVAEQRYRDAERTLAGVLKTLEQGDESALFADALTVQGVIWARLWNYQSSINVLRRAAEVAEAAGAFPSAGQVSDTPIHEKNFSLYGAVHELEAKLIGEALNESGGSITKAAKLPGLTHQTLISILDKRHKALAGKRKPAQKRLKSIIKKDFD